MDYGRGQYPGLQSQCIVGYIFNSVGLIITRKTPTLYIELFFVNRFERIGNQ
jgi:hypothetical protein